MTRNELERLKRMHQYYIDAMTDAASAASAAEGSELAFADGRVSAFRFAADLLGDFIADVEKGLT